MKNILITGATSFIGCYLIRALQQNPENNIYALVRPNSTNKKKLNEFKNLKILELNIDKINEVESMLTKVDVCFHLAWDGTRVPERYDDCLQRKNYVYSMDVYNALKRIKCNTFIGVGSQAEYGFCNDEIDEETNTNPNTAYGKYKLLTCNELMKKAKEDGLRFIWGRVFSIYGKGDYENTLIMNAIRKMRNNESIDMTEGKQYWNYLYVEDLAKILVNLCENEGVNGIYNLASDDTRMLKSYMEEIKNTLKSKSQLNFGAVPYRQEGIVNIMPSIDRLKLVLNNFSFTKFSDAIKKI